MKTLLLIADSTYVYQDENGCDYFRGSFSPKTWERYLSIAEEIIFVCRKDVKSYSKEETEAQLQRSPSERIKVLFVTNPRASVGNFFNISIKRKNKKLIEDAVLKANGVIVRTMGSVSTTFLINTIKKNYKKYLYECVGNAWDALWNYGIKGKIMAPSAYLNEKRLAANANAVLYVTEKYLQKWYPTMAPQIGISDVDIPVATNDVLEARIKKINSIGRHIILGTAGSVDVAYKGQEYVIKAIAELKRRGLEGIEYQLAGSGDASRLKSIAEREGVRSQVKFMGTLSHDAVLNWFDEIDVYLQPSMLEGMPRALIEAMSRGLPCFGSNVGGIPELLDRDTMFAKKSVKEIADCIEKISGEFMVSQATRNFELSKKFYPTEKNLQRMCFYDAFEKTCK